MQPTSRRLLSVATTVVVSAGICLQAGIPPAAADMGAVLRYVCTTSAGTQEVGVRIAAATPPAAMVGMPVQLGTTEVAVDLPSGMLDDVFGVASAETPAGEVPSPGLGVEPFGVARLDVRIEQGERSWRAGWPDFALAAGAQRDGALQMMGHGVTPPVTPRDKGALRWMAGNLTLSLTTPGSERTSVPCSPKKAGELGRVEVQETRSTARGGTPGNTGGPQAAAEAQPDEPCPVIPPPGVDPRYAINDKDQQLAEILTSPPIPKGLVRNPESGYLDGLPYCITATGFANVKKLGTAVPISVETQLRRGVYVYRPSNGVMGTNRVEQFGYIQSSARPLEANVLAFGFMPTRASSEAIQVPPPAAEDGKPVTGNLRISALFNENLPPNDRDDSELFARSYIQLKAGDVSVNGVPLDVGDQCHSKTTLLDAYSYMGNQNMGYLIPSDGQTLQVRELTVPSFSGCGVDEDLSPLLTASISGGANYGLLDAGRWCSPTSGQNCDENGHGFNPETWTISPGGDVTATAHGLSLASGGSSVTCDLVTSKFHLDAQHWRARFALAKTDFSFSGCRLSIVNGTTIPVDLSQDGDSWLRGIQMASDDVVQLRFEGITLDASVKLSEDDDECRLRFGYASFFPPPTKELPTSINGNYNIRTGEIEASVSRAYVSPKTTCSIPGFRPTGLVTTSPLVFKVDPIQRITQP
ncbi:hypothetical protein E1293_27005 [Actinomadura darangshiensis]|uniref:Secreted protein n=1 Tax=Actinomadura darangshiensis TaxID=705336 RepID=A0A4R5AX22_9ACTN|nr:hypothetical protein [Actinomadura darangshiensis]TDD76559.1 hypothetical protein E1293_27005 [Actinomadura darangshiensis]